jgi:hypothetical protein
MTTFRKSKVVLWGEGRGKISAPHSVNILGTKILLKWGRYDPYWIIILFFIYLITLWVEKLEESYRRIILAIGLNLGPKKI